ncbi:RICIN domain-containing protein [Peterkaempfera sp. SMS 1(5)a]|uniref:RICIN domain-containing protein n=1 Tax=Peterkaempfera podocarpi TaxID=3232308 RepID=UPI00366B5FDA
MASYKLGRRLAVVAFAALLPLAGTSSAHATDLGNFYIKNLWTKQCVDLGGTGAQPNGTVVWQDTCLNNGAGDNQEWGFLTTRTTSHGTQLYEIVNVKSQRCLDLPGTGADGPGTAVSLITCQANQAADNQEWYIDSLDGTKGMVLLINYASSGNQPGVFMNDECLDVSGFAEDDGDEKGRAPLTIYPCTTNSATNVKGSWYDGVPYDDHVWDLQAV